MYILILKKIKRKVINKLLIFFYIDVQPLNKSNSLIKQKNLLNSSFSFENTDISYDLMENDEKCEFSQNDLKNPYLKKDCVPNLEFIDQNYIILNNREVYEIKIYLKT